MIAISLSNFVEAAALSIGEDETFSPPSVSNMTPIRYLESRLEESFKTLRNLKFIEYPKKGFDELKSVTPFKMLEDILRNNRYNFIDIFCSTMYL